jgi:hypothetical protein
MSYKVRLLTPSQKVIPFSVMKSLLDRIKLATGTEQLWERVQIHSAGNTVLATIDCDIVSPDSVGGTILSELRTVISNKYPVKARQYLDKYFYTVRVIYTFNTFIDRMDQDTWVLLGEVQYFLKASLGGITQSDNEGFYNEMGDYILYQMYENAFGSVPAAVLNDKGQWISYSLRLGDEKAVDLFKNGVVPKQGFFTRMFGL